MLRSMLLLFRPLRCGMVISRQFAVCLKPSMLIFCDIDWLMLKVCGPLSSPS